MGNTMNPGTRVRMSKVLKKEMRKTSKEHIKEFGNCVGVAMGLMDYGTQLGPEVDVRWLPSNLCYGYLPETLDVVENIAQPKAIKPGQMRGAKARFYNPPNGRRRLPSRGSPIDTPKYIYVIKKVHKRIVEVNIVWADPNLTELVPGLAAIFRKVCEDDMFFGDTDWYCAPKDIKLRVQGNS